MIARVLQSTVLSLAVVSALMTPACTVDSPYFGKANPPPKQQLCLETLAEPATLDPEISTDLWESYIVYALFEGLTHFHLQTLEAMAALATDYEIDTDQTRYTFYLRGHREPTRDQASEYRQSSARIYARSQAVQVRVDRHELEAVAGCRGQGAAGSKPWAPDPRPLESMLSPSRETWSRLLL
jgi:ABC-type oligopeptide transport system substrate-binding subunit